MNEDDLVYRLRKRAEIRRQIPTRKSVQENQLDRIADLLEEAANEIERLRDHPVWIDTLTKEQQYEWYCRAKKFLVRFKETEDDFVDLEKAIKDYEVRNGIL
jgi:hypothetical protein